MKALFFSLFSFFAVYFVCSFFVVGLGFCLTGPVPFPSKWYLLYRCCTSLSPLPPPCSLFAVPLAP